MITITPREERAVRRLLDAALDQPKPSAELVECLNRCLRIWHHDCAPASRFTDTQAA